MEIVEQIGREAMSSIFFAWEVAERLLTRRGPGVREGNDVKSWKRKQQKGYLDMITF